MRAVLTIPRLRAWSHLFRPRIVCHPRGLTPARVVTDPRRVVILRHSILPNGAYLPPASAVHPGGAAIVFHDATDDGQAQSVVAVFTRACFARSLPTRDAESALAATAALRSSHDKRGVMSAIDCRIFR